MLRGPTEGNHVSAWALVSLVFALGVGLVLFGIGVLKGVPPVGRRRQTTPKDRP